MAEFILKDICKKKGIEEEFFISSSATSTEEIWGGRGNPVNPPARAELKKHGISCDGKTAVQLKKDDYEKYDLFLCMDNMNYRNILRIFAHDKDEKVRRLMTYTSRGGEVDDPWYSGDFSTTYNDIRDGCTGLLKELGWD